MLFSKDTSTHKRYKCARGAENIHDLVDVEFAGDVTQWLTSFNKEYGQIAGH